ncbi:PAS domain S-box protein [Arenibacter lacus]|uniref:PAS domain S-box protein n=1 Tax=Arenibacter lacus TaxID=2608629 RepID=UPI00168BA33E|nr:PAS domain S-box protein [Arenibacter lacus]
MESINEQNHSSEHALNHTSALENGIRSHFQKNPKEILIIENLSDYDKLKENRSQFRGAHPSCMLIMPLVDFSGRLQGILVVTSGQVITLDENVKEGLKIVADLIIDAIVDQYEQPLPTFNWSYKELGNLSVSETVESIAIFNWKLELKTNNFYVNPRFLQFLGYASDELQVDSLSLWKKLVHPLDRQKFTKEVANWTENNTTSHELEFRMIHKHGQVVWLCFSLSKKIKTEWNHSKIIEGEIQDITAQKKVWGQIDFLSPKLSSVIQAGYNWLSIIDNKGTITYSNIGSDLIVGFSQEELQGTNYSEFVHREDRENMQSNLTKFLNHQPFIASPFRFKHKDGSWRWIEVILLNYNEDPEIQGVVVNARDITQTKSVISKLKNSQENQKFLFNSCTQPKYLLDIKTYKILEVNNKMVKLFGYSKEELIGMNGLNLISPTDEPNFIKAVEDSKFKEFTNSKGIFTYKSKTGELFQLELVGHSIKLEDRNCILVSCKDVSDRETYLQDLKESEQRLKKAAAIAQLGYYSLDINTLTCTWSEEVYSIWGRCRENFNLNYENFLGTIHPDDLGHFDKPDHHLFSDPGMYNLTYRIVLPDGSIKWVHALGQLVKGGNDKPLRIEGTIQDVTEQKQEDQQLKLLESVVTNTGEAAIIFEALPFHQYPHRIIYVNQAFVTMTGYSKKELLGQSSSLWKDPYWVGIEFQRMKVFLDGGEAFELTIQCRSKVGEDYWVNMVVNPITDQEGKYTQWVALVRDVTETQNLQFQKSVFSKIGSVFQEDAAIETCLTKMLGHLIDSLDYQLGQVWLPSLDNTSMSLVAHTTSSDSTKSIFNILGSLDSCKKGEGLPWQVWKSQEILLWDSIEKEVGFERNSVEDVICTQEIVGIPLKQNDGVKAVLVLGKEKSLRSPRFYGELFKQLQFRLGSDITRRQLEIELDEIFRLTPAILIKSDINGYIKKINPAVNQILGYSEDEVLGKNVTDYIHPDDILKTIDKLEQLKQGKPVTYFENRYLTKEGKTKWISWSANLTQEKGIAYAVGTDITEKKVLEELVEEVSELARIGAWEINIEKGSVYWSEMTKKIHEVDNNYVPDIEGIISFYSDQENSEMFSMLIDKSYYPHEAFDIEIQINSAIGKKKWVRVIGKPEFNNGECIRVYGSIQDIHQLKTAQLDYIRTKEEKNSILESIGDAFLSFTEKGIVTYWNKKAEDCFGIKRESVLGHPIEQVFSQFAKHQCYKDIQKAIRKKDKFIPEEYFPHLNKWYEVTIYPSDYGISIFLKDVSERIIAEREIQLTNERFAKVVEATNDVIWDWDIQENTLFLSEAFKSLFGHETGIENQNLQLWADKLHPDDKARVINSFYKAVHDPKINSWEAEYRFLKASGEYAYVLDKGIVIREGNGTANRLIGAMTDISLRKNYENSLKQLNRTLEERNRNVETQNKILKDIAWTQSHIVRAPLARLLALTYLIRDGLVEEEELIDLLDKICLSATELDSIIKDIIRKSQPLVAKKL